VDSNASGLVEIVFMAFVCEMQQLSGSDSNFPIKFTACADLINETPQRDRFCLDRDEFYKGVLTPQARTAHQPIHASKAQNSPIKAKIAANTGASGISQAPARRKTAAIPPRATRPLLSMLGFIAEKCGLWIVAGE
jgi:hypothetical protein